MRELDDEDPGLEVFDAIHRELVTIIGHCTFHRSVLADLILREAGAGSSPRETLQGWRHESMRNIESLRFSDLNKGDKALANAVFEEASRSAETFWNLLVSRCELRERFRTPEDDSAPAAPLAEQATETASDSDQDLAASRKGR